MNGVQHTFFKQKAAQIGVQLNDIQQQAVTTISGPLLLLASPGSGKTTTIIMRIGYMIEVLGIHPAKIKAVTFSKASARDMQNRFIKFFPHLEPVAFSTIHSLAYEIVRQKLSADYVQYAILEENEGVGISKKRLLRELFEQFNKSKITEDQLEELLTYISYIKNKMLPRNEWAIPEIKVPKKVEIFEAYEDFKMTGTHQLLIDFDDMLVMANDILREQPQILQHYQSRFDYVLTDESQDTSAVQHAIIEQLVAKHQNLCVVADEDQSIYSWRGAEPEYLLNFKHTYPQATVLMMTQNYRSTKSVVEPANVFIKRNKKRYDKNMFTENEQGESIKFQQIPNYHMQAEYLVQAIKQQKTTDSTAILYRNNTSAIALLDAFERAGIPFFMKDSAIRFFTHWVVEDVLNFMRFAYNTKNVSVYEKIYRKMNGYVTVKQMQQLQQLDGDKCIFTKLLEDVSLSDYQPDYLKKLRQTFGAIQFDKTSASEMLEMIRGKLGYEKALKKMSDSLGFNYENLINILDVLGLIARHTETMTDFANRLKRLDELARNSHRKEVQHAVTFSTLHSAKGLEFDTVYMIDCIEGVLPAVEKSKIVDDPKLQAEYEEETRLFYVGITRAIKQLTIISYKKRFGVAIQPSEFMKVLEVIVYPEKNKQPVTKKVVHTKQAKQYRNEHTILSSSDLNIGRTINHVLFGQGKIITLANDTIEIQFEAGNKKFVVDTCLQQGYLEKVE